MSTNGAKIGRNLQRLRVAAGLSQYGLSERAGMCRAMIAAIEVGRYNAVKSTTLERLAGALNVRVSALIDDNPSLSRKRTEAADGAATTKQ